MRLAEYFDIRLHHAVSFEDLVSNYCRAYAESVEKNPSEDRIVQDLCLSMFSDYVAAHDWPYPQISKDVLDTIFSKFERQYLTSSSIYGVRNDDSNTVVISTIHSSKGLEYDIVFVVSMDHEVFPKTKKINEEYDRYISGIADLEKSVKALTRLRYKVDEDTFQSIIDECDPESIEGCDPEDIEYFKEELIRSRSDIVELNANGVEAYQQNYDDYISPMIEMRRKGIRALQLEKRTIDERYYLCEDRYLSQDGYETSIRSELDSIDSERSEMESRISQAKKGLESFLESIWNIELMHGRCIIASQYFADIDHLNHMELLKADLEKEREEKIQEELRSFYVSISRARDLLYLCTTYGFTRSEFIGFIRDEDKEDYPLTTKSEDDMRELVETYKASIAAESSRRNPDLAKIDEATSQMMGGLTDSLRTKCDTYILNYLRDNPEFKRLTGYSKDFLTTALRLDYLGKMMGTDFNNEVLLNLQRSGEELLKAHITKDAIRITADEDFCKALNSDLYYLIQASSRVGQTPDVDYLKRVFVLPDRYNNYRKNFKDMTVGLYAVFSGQWPNLLNKYRTNWDFNELSIAPEEFVVTALDLCNIRNKTTHYTMDETWKNDQTPYAYDCLKKLIIAVSLS